jgi:hypothetical protein
MNVRMVVLLLAYYEEFFISLYGVTEVFALSHHTESLN